MEVDFLHALAVSRCVSSCFSAPSRTLHARCAYSAWVSKAQLSQRSRVCRIYSTASCCTCLGWFAILVEQPGNDPAVAHWWFRRCSRAPVQDVHCGTTPGWRGLCYQHYYCCPELPFDDTRHNCASLPNPTLFLDSNRFNAALVLELGSLYVFLPSSDAEIAAHGGWRSISTVPCGNNFRISSFHYPCGKMRHTPMVDLDRVVDNSIVYWSIYSLGRRYTTSGMDLYCYAKRHRPWLYPTSTDLRREFRREAS